jgi:phosphonate transport system ATP-binding protein
MQGAEFIVADEPIASLDPHSTRRVMDILADLNRRDGITILVSLHQVEYALRYCARIVALKQGAIVYDGPTEALTPETLAAIYGAETDELFASLAPWPAGGVEARWRDGARPMPNSEMAVRLDFARRPPVDQRHKAHG